MKKRPFTTLFLLQSVDGRISTGSTPERDVDKDFPLIDGVREGLSQYYDLEQETDLWSLNTGKVMAKVGVNTTPYHGDKLPVSFVIIDNAPHLTQAGVSHLLEKLHQLVIVTSCPHHPAFALADNPSLHVMQKTEPMDFQEIFEDLSSTFGITHMTIQSGSTLNATLVRANLIDSLSIVIAPVLIGGTATPSLIGGESVKDQEGLKNLKSLVLEQCNVLKNNYLHLIYAVKQTASENQPQT